MKIKTRKGELDLSKAFPLEIGDWADLESEGVIVTEIDEKSGRETTVFNQSFPNVVKFLEVLLRKIYGDEAKDWARSIPFTESTKVQDYLNKQMGVDEPTVPTGSSTSPTPSEATDGPSRKSRNAASRT